ncbi:MAG: hypothetical protein ACM31C_23300 [Acidobacteriota bacterium]
MTYRDDREADQARISALEAELALAREKIASLEHRGERALVVAGQRSLARGDRAHGWAGAPLQLELIRDFDGEFPAERFEELVATIREVTGDHGQTELLRSSMTWRAAASQRGTGPFTMLTVAVKAGRTTVIATDRLGQLAGAIYGGFGGGIGGGGLMLPLGLAMITMPMLAPVLVAGWLGGVFVAARALFKHNARHRADLLARVFDATVAKVDAGLRARP